jgi:hypothetical protein
MAQLGTDDNKWSSLVKVLTGIEGLMYVYEKTSKTFVTLGVDN